MSLSGRKAITPTANSDPSNAEQVMHVDRIFSRVDFFATKGSSDNTGTVWIGFAGTSALSSSEAGAPLATGDSYTMFNVNLKDVYIAGANDGDAVLFNATD